MKTGFSKVRFFTVMVVLTLICGGVITVPEMIQAQDDQPFVYLPIISNNSAAVNGDQSIDQPADKTGDQPSIAAAACSRATIRKDSQGTNVTHAQHQLLKVGDAYEYGTPAYHVRTTGGADGTFGDGTERAVVAYQRIVFPNQPDEHDGIVGPATWEKLGCIEESTPVGVSTSSPAPSEAHIRVYAHGDEGQEAMEIRINGQTVAQWIVWDSPDYYDYFHPLPVSADQISVHFTNEYYDPENDYDHNLTVDKIVLNGTTYETEDPSVIGKGHWDGSSCAQVAAHRAEKLNCNGYFAYASASSEPTPSATPVPSEAHIRVYAHGDEGQEAMEIRINGQTVAQWIVWDSPDYYDYFHPLPVSADQISVHFTNEYYDPENDYDHNLTVDKIVLNGTTYETEDPSVIGKGHWDGSSCAQVAAHRAERLNCNGYFAYASSSSEPTPIPTIQPTPIPTSEPAPTQSSSYASNLQRIRNSAVRNRNHDDSIYRYMPMADIPIEELYGPRSDYLGQPGGSHEQHFPTLEGGNFRVACEFSHFAYDDPLVHPNKPGAAHLHMFWGNTDVNAYSTYDTLLNSGSGTCNGMELNRSGYWAPAMFDADGYVRVPDRIVIYYKGYGLARENAEVYPPGAAMIATENVHTVARDEGGLLYPNITTIHTGNSAFHCADRHGGNRDNGRTETIPVCDGADHQDWAAATLEMHVKFPNCWNREDPSDPDNWGLAGVESWFNSRCEDRATVPNIEYIIVYQLEENETTAGWYLSSDIDPMTETRSVDAGSSTHADWWGGWNPAVNEMWLNNCAKYKTDQPSGCGGGYLSDGGPDNQNPYDGPALKFRPLYDGPLKVAAETLFAELCDADRTIGSAEQAAYCNPTGHDHSGEPPHTPTPTPLPTSTPQPTNTPTHTPSPTSTSSEGGHADANAGLAAFRNPDPALQEHFNVPKDQLPYDLLATQPSSPPSSQTDGNFRVGCHYSHLLYDDPIVYPGEPGRSHLHMFFGNTGVNANTTNETLINSGGGSCGGYALNRTGYWMPALFDDQGRVRIPDDIVMYYKSKHPELVRPYPQGLKMIAAKDNASRAGVNGVQWGCTGPFEASGVNGDIIPDRCPNGWLKLGIQFPQCWDGVNLDSADHKSHMYFQPDNSDDRWRCPASHPVMFTQYSLLTYWYVGPDADLSNWYVSSDPMNNTSRGDSVHADWWGGWDERTQQEWIDNCIHGQRNCSTGVMSANRQLIRRWPGQSYPNGVGDGVTSEAADFGGGYDGPKIITLPEVDDDHTHE